jgi:hypothetical protein
MKLLFDDDLVEGVVLLAAGGRVAGIPTLQIRRFHLDRERGYAVGDPDARGQVFARVHLDWFREWGFEGWLAAAAEWFPMLRTRLSALGFRLARTRQEEGAELYCDSAARWRGLVALRPARFEDRGRLRGLLHHELGHLADMLDPGFGYSPEWGSLAGTIAQQRRVQERYRLLWDVSLDGRLTRVGLETVAGEEVRREEFWRGFAFLPDERRRELFDALWRGDLARHERLLALAADPRGLEGTHVPVPGAPCPLCGFAAFNWTQAEGLRAAVRQRMRESHPGWTEGESVCERCAEMYEAVTGAEYPATICR